MSFAVGSLVKARGREWVVLPESDDDLLMVRPLGGTDDESTGIYLPLETVDSATFDLPDISKPGDYRSCRLLRDAVRLGFRSSAGPFRSVARIAVEPRPYQLVPLLMALKLDPVRLLIADDVGIGKTIEAALVARELLDRGEVTRLAVLCPPHLAEQWQAELNDKFHIEAELVLAGTASRLERNLAAGESLFDRHPYVIVSLDYIKSLRRRDEFLRACPELVIVDEAHTCAYGEERGKQMRHSLVSDLSRSGDRHMIFVTATPHSGKEQAFRSLLGLLNPEFANLPTDLTGRHNEPVRRRLAQHFVQRRRADIRHFLQTDTPFPEREEAEKAYLLSEPYRKFFDKVFEYTREQVYEEGLNQFRKRVRWWSALGLLRALASSPAAAAATLRNRASASEAETEKEADEIGRRTVMDLLDDETSEGIDVTPGFDYETDESEETRNRRRLRRLATEADSLRDEKDEKLLKAIPEIRKLLKEGFQPIIFCRFIDTAEYVAEYLRRKLPKKVEVAAVTGRLPPSEREARVVALGQHDQHVLVCTDCLSEGINLQDYFDAVVHYDLAWNPTRHEQRDGRVDRYGQPSELVRVLTYYGRDNQIDGIVLDVLLRKHRTIRSALGISVPVPVSSENFLEAIFEGLLLREKAGGVTDEQTFFQFYEPEKKDLHGIWEDSADREKRSRTLFAQETIKVEAVAQELAAVRNAIGSMNEVAAFVRDALEAHGGVFDRRNGSVRLNLDRCPRALKDALNQDGELMARFELPVPKGTVYLSRTHPFVESLGSHVMDTAFDPILEGISNRSGVVYTNQVELRTTVLLARFRFHITRRDREGAQPLLAEESGILAFTGSPSGGEWLEVSEVENLLGVSPDRNITPDAAQHHLKRVIDGWDAINPHLEEEAQNRGKALLEAHRRVRDAARMRGVQYRVEPTLPVDVLGVYVYLPAG